MEPILSVRHLETTFTSDFGSGVVVDDVSFDVPTGQTLCIVGESGCGKSVTCLSIMGLLGRGGKVTGGQVVFDGRELTGLTEKELDEVRGKDVSMIFQDPMTALNPVFTVGEQIAESLQLHEGLEKNAAMERAKQMLELVGIPGERANEYPHQFSGGMKQRVVIAIALACNPKLLIADEPTTALDVTIQKQIMSLLKQLQQENGMSILLITHDMGLVAQMADQVIVMYAGQIVERAPVADLFHNPAHPYTRALLKSVPSIRDTSERVLESIQDTVPEHYEKMTGCRFRSRCPHATAACEQIQAAVEVAPEHLVCCSRWKEAGA